MNPGDKTHQAVQPTTEVRKLASSVKLRLANILDSGKQWKDLMASIPLTRESEYPKKYTNEHIQLVESASYSSGRKATEILLEEWGTSGRLRPTVTDLIKLLMDIKLIRAANYLKVDILNEAPILPTNIFDVRKSSNPTSQNRPQILSTVEDLTRYNIGGGEEKSLNSGQPGVDGVDQPNVPDIRSRDAEDESHLTVFSYKDLSNITSSFCDIPQKSGGNKLGEGGFGTVYLGEFKGGEKVAVKRIALGDHSHKQFRTEVQVLSRFKHDNILQLFGYSDDGPYACLVYAYIVNGSLEDQLASEVNAQNMDWNTRVKIAVGTSHGILHLHTFESRPFVHRDIKSANILLDINYLPKVGDCGLVREGASGAGPSLAMTTTVLGTSAYMAPEAFKGDISAKMDVYSYGVVILELLTGLPAYDEKRRETGMDLISHVDNLDGFDDMTPLLDSRIPSCQEEIVKLLSDLSYEATKEKRSRPTMKDVCDRFISATCLQDVLK